VGRLFGLCKDEIGELVTAEGLKATLASDEIVGSTNEVFLLGVPE
jgi:hypothetical protein